MNNNLQLKTLGPRLAFLVTELYERQKTIFSVRDVESITGLSPNSTRGLVNRLVGKVVATDLNRVCSSWCRQNSATRVTIWATPMS